MCDCLIFDRVMCITVLRKVVREEREQQALGIILVFLLLEVDCLVCVIVDCLMCVTVLCDCLICVTVNFSTVLCV